MAQPAWTVVVVPHRGDRMRTLQLSLRTVRMLAATVGALVLVCLGLAGALVLKARQQWRAAQLERENRLLAAEVEQIRGRLHELSRSLETLSDKERRYRLLAGLPVDGPVDTAAEPRPDLFLGRRSYTMAALTRLNPALGRRVAAASADLDALLARARTLGVRMDQALVAMRGNTERLAATPSIAPSYGALSSLFSRSRYHPVLKISRPHKGIDIAAPVGTPVRAPARGIVRYAGWKSGGYGNTVELAHGYGYVTRFAHLSKIRVRVGQVLERGDILGEVGATGLVSGPHLHYEVMVNGRQVDPLNYIVSDVIP